MERRRVHVRLATAVGPNKFRFASRVSKSDGGVKISSLLLCALLIAGSALFSQSIEGTVLDSVTGLPLGGAKVSVEQGGKPVYQATTDEQGFFRIQLVKAGAYTASFQKPDFFTSTERPSSLAFEVGSNVVHLRGRLTPRSRVAGRVLDELGRPVSGAELLLDGVRTGQTARSDAEGNFLFRAVPGRYVLSARAPRELPPPTGGEGERLGWVNTYYPGVLDLAASVKISVQAGSDVLGRDIALRAGRLAGVRGTVFDNNGNPAAKVSVQAERVDEILSDSIRVVSKDDGSFEFSSLPEGEWRIFAETDSGSPKLRAFAVIQVAGHDMDQLDLRLAPPFALTGSVALVVAEGARADQKKVVIFLKPLVAGAEGLSQGTTDSNGNFRIENVYPGKYKVIAVSPGPPYFLNSARVGNRELLGQYVDLLAGTLPVEIKFESEGGEVQGVVEDCASGTVVLAPQDGAVREPQFVYTTQCGELGKFQIANIRPGDYYAFAFDQWDGAAELLAGLDQALVNKAVRVRVEPGAIGNVALRMTLRNRE